MEDLAVSELFSGVAARFPTIYDFEQYLAKLPQLPEKVDHIFSGGVYIRQLTIPEDSIIIGKRHRHETCNMLLKGEMSIYMGEGVPTQRIKGPLLFTSPPMTKKMAYCHEECIFANIHPTEETDLEKIENEFIIPEEEYLQLPEGETK